MKFLIFAQFCYKTIILSISKMPRHQEHSSSSKSSKSSKSCSSSEESHHEKKYEIEDIYHYMKNRLVDDEDLMIAGSDAYVNYTNTIAEVVVNNHIIPYNNLVMKEDIDYVQFGSPFFVRESGIYIAFFIILVDTACQFTFFVNGDEVPSTCVGTNAGAGQVVSRHMLQLKKNDSVVVRDFTSSGGSFISNLFAGGTNPGNSSTFLMMKIAPYEEARPCKDLEDLSHSKRKLFRKLTEMVVCDRELMPKGFNVTGVFRTTLAQDVTLEADVVFDKVDNVKGMVWNASAPTQIKICEDGIYKVFFVTTTNKAAQIALTINGVAVESSTQGTNKGAGQLTTRTLFTLKKNDIITVRNHSTTNGGLIISSKAGGLQQSNSALLTVFKIAPLCKPKCEPVSHHLARKLEHLYPYFKSYLLEKDELQIAGSKSFLSVNSKSVQIVPQNNPFYFCNKFVERDVHYRNGDVKMEIEKSGVYDIFADISTNEPVQLALFINGTADTSTICGRDSGGNRCIMRQFVFLKRGDCVTINNYQSASATVTTSDNSGGHLPGNSVMFMMFLLHPQQCDE